MQLQTATSMQRQSAPKTCLFNTSIDKARLVIDITIRPEKGPHGGERMVTINKHQKYHSAQDSIHYQFANHFLRLQFLYL